MCGIAGKVSPRGGVERDLVERMCDVVRHRGPDSHGLWTDGRVGLGVRRLAVIDLDTGDQPLLNESDTVVVIQNGEIYNYRELRTALEAAGHTFRSKSDTEVIVHLYEEHGDACLHFLRGMFAVAVWDIKRQRLLLARDRIGKKPLFYAVRDDTLWFGSEAKSILEDPEVPRDVDPAAIDAFLRYLYVPHPRSAFSALKKLPPAHILTWQEGTVEVSRYWRLSYRPDHRLRGPELHEAIRGSLLEATRLRLRSDVPVGAFLSGGVDSSAVVAAMVRESSKRVRTFSIGFDVPAFDETQYAREVSELLGTEHHELSIRPDAIELLPRLVWHYGEPFADSSAIPSFYLAELTRRDVTVALNGDGGDENFAGYPRYHAIALAERLGRLVPETTQVWLERLVAPVARGASAGTVRARLGKLAKALRQEPWHRYADWISYLDQSEVDRLYTPEFAMSVAHEWAPTVIRDAYVASDASSTVNRLLDVDVNVYLPGDLLVKMDIASMAHSLEVRSPLLDHVFMELAAAIPADDKLRGRRSKAVFKDALRPWLPARILERPKMGFAVPLAQWFRGPLKDLPREVLLDAKAAERGLFRPDRINTLIDEHVEGRRDHADTLWALLQLELWFRTFVDRSPAPIALSAA